MIECKVILFDWGGTLADVEDEERTWHDCVAAAHTVLHHHGINLPPSSTGLRQAFELHRTRSQSDPAHHELNLDDVLTTWFRKLEVQTPNARVRESAAHAFWSAWTNCLKILDDAPAVLAFFRDRGFKTGLVSNVSAPPEYCEQQLKHLKLWNQLDTLSFSSGVGRRKPAQEIYDDALRKIAHIAGADGCATHDILFVGDSPSCDVRGPAALGMRTALITHPAVRSLWDKSEYENLQPDLRIAHLAELKTALHLSD